MSGGVKGQSVISRGIILKNFLHHSSLDGDVAYNITEPHSVIFGLPRSKWRIFGMDQGYLNSVELRGSKIGDEKKIDFEAFHEGMKMAI